LSHAFLPSSLHASRVIGLLLLLAAALMSAVPANAATAPVLVSAVSRKVHGSVGTFDLPLSLVLSSPTTEPRQGPSQIIVFTFNKAVVSGNAQVIEGVAAAGTPSFSGNDMVVPLTGVGNFQYITVLVSGVAAGDVGTGGNALVRIGYLPGDVSQNRVVTLSDLGLVNAQVAQFVNSGNFLKDVNASGTLSLADKGLTNAQVTKALVAPGTLTTTCGTGGCVIAGVGFANPTLTVPAGALAAPVNISMFDQPGDPSDPSVFHVYTFLPSGTTFAIPATVDLPAPPLPNGGTAVIEVSDDGVTWTEIPTTLSNGRVTGPISHFSKCRTRETIVGEGDLLILDIVNYQDLAQLKGTSGLTIPATSPVLEKGACYSGDLYGVCIKVKNPTKNLKGSTCPVPTPSPPPPGCHQIHIVPWQCYTRLTNFPAPFNGANQATYEGQHCDRSGLLIPCAESIYNMETLVPAGIPANTEMWIDISFLAGQKTPANGVFPSQCLGSSFIGVDAIFREPQGSCAPGAPCDWQGGIRSAKDGPFVAVPSGRQLFLPAGFPGCAPTPPATTCPATCNPPAGQTTCKVEWEWLVNHAPNYPTLHIAPSGTAIKNFVFGSQE